MKQTRLIMGMPVVVEVVDEITDLELISVFDYFREVDARFSTYKPESEISRINRGEIAEADFSPEMQEIFRLSELTKQQTKGYFEISHNGKIDPSGIVKGWAIRNAADILREMGYTNFYVDAGGDIEVSGHNSQRQPWVIGIRNPFDRQQNVKVLQLSEGGVATSGTYIRGQHVYDPFAPAADLAEIVSITVIGPDIYEADRFATAAFAMQRQGIELIEELPQLEGYMIDKAGMATYTSKFNDYLVTNVQAN